MFILIAALPVLSHSLVFLSVLFFWKEILHSPHLLFAVSDIER